MTLNLSSAIDVEEGVVGACMVSSAAVEAAVRILTPSDFASPNLSHAFDAIVRLHERGSGVTATTVDHELTAIGFVWDGRGPDLVRWMNNGPAVAHVPHYAELVTKHSTKRRLAALGAALANDAQDPTTDPGELADRFAADLLALDSPTLARSPGDTTVEEFLARPRAARPPEVIPDLLALDHRAVIVAPEGRGKSEFVRQLVVLPAWGIHPLTFDPCPPVRTLLIDLENPADNIDDRLSKLTAMCKRHTTGRAVDVLWHRAGGIDLRKRADRLALEDVLRRRRPSLVAISPLYKTYTRRGTESDEQVAVELQAIFDDLRTRFGFALVLEDHAPLAPSGQKRDLRPYGSSRWLRWPEFGVKLIPDRHEPDVLDVDRWRGDRVRARWPIALHRGDVWPWVPTFDTPPSKRGAK